jgi:glycosyltransferase involved in cell wall biosynthesis
MNETDLDYLERSPAFDAAWYSTRYPDVPLSGLQPARHFAKYGVLMRRSPSPGLRVADYHLEFPEAAGQNPVLHYETRGRLMGYDLDLGGVPEGTFVGPGTTFAESHKRPLVTVVMTAFNAEATIEGAIDSLLRQTLRSLEILVVDDLSTDGTAALVERIAERDRRVRLLRLAANRGTYWAKNLGLYHARAPFVALSDSDDISLPARLQTQYDALVADPRRLVCYIDYRRVDPTGATVTNRGREHRLGFMTMMARRELFNIAGFFDSVRIAADDEFHSRLRILLSPSQYCHLPLPLYHALVRSDSLTAVDAVRLDKTPAKGNEGGALAFLSPTRQAYVNSYKEWHARPGDLRMEFPLRRRPFAAPSIAVEAVAEGETITASMATFPPRLPTLARVVARILPQVDLLRIHLNNFDSVPDFLRHEKIRFTRSQDQGDLRDNGKFLQAGDIPPGFHFTLDDDIVYPRNYVRYMIAKVLQYDRKAVVGVHGSVLADDFVRYHDGVSRRTWHFQKELRNDEPVHILGTGTVAYHTSTLRFDLEGVTSTGMVDLWFARAAQEQEVPMIAVARGRNYLREMMEHVEGSIYVERRRDDSNETAFVTSHAPWRLRRPFAGGTAGEAAPHGTLAAASA